MGIAASLTAGLRSGSCLGTQSCVIQKNLASILSRSTCFWRVTVEANKGAAWLTIRLRLFGNIPAEVSSVKLNVGVILEPLFDALYAVKHPGFVTLYLVWWYYFLSVT